MTLAEDLLAQAKAGRGLDTPVVPQVPQTDGQSRARQLLLDAKADSGSLLSGAKDTVVNLPMAVTGLAKSFMDLGRLFTGDQPVINEFTGAEDPNIFKTGSKFIEDKIEKPYKQAVLSDAALAQEERVSRAIDDPNVTLTDLPGILAANPRAVMMGAENSGLTMLAPGAVGATLARGAEKNLPLLGKLGAKKAMGLGVAGGNMALNAADTYGSTDDLEQADRLKGAGVSALATLVADRLTGGGADKLVAQILRGEGKLAGNQTARSVAAAALKGGLKSASKEGAQEFIEEGGGALGEQVARDQGLDLNKIGKRGTFGAVLGALTGGAMGGVHSARQQRAENAVAADTFGEDFTPQQREEASNAVAAALKQMSQPTQPVQQPAPVQPEAEETAGRTTIGARLESNPEVVLQNRDRTSAASVTQMNQIAANPDYGRTGPSRDFGNGAPVVAYGSVPENQLGRTDYATTADGERIPVQYAVVDADSVLTSNNINGQTNKDYAAAGEDRVRAIAGNGRVTGLAEAYRRGTAAKYREELTADAAMSGVDPQVIQGMKSPILVRVMPKEKIRPDIGDISNTTGNMTMTATETAANDVNRLNFDNLTFDDNGNFDERTVRDFVRQMPAAEQAGLIEEKSGRPTRQAFERLQNALFKKAYGNDDLVRLAAQAADPEVRNVINALTQTAPKLARLEGLGNLDLRELVTQAAEVAVNAKRQGVSLEKYGRQQDMTIDPAVATILRIFAENPRSVKDMVRFLSDMADFAYAEGSKSDTDLFGSVPRATRADVLSRVDQELNDAAAEREATRRAKEALKRNDGGSPQTVEQSPGVRSAGENAPAATADGRGQGNAQPDQEGLTLTGETEAEAQANAAAKEKFEADEKKAREDAIAAEKADRLAKATKAGVDAAVDHFELTDDFTSDVDAVRGQKGLSFSKAGDRIKIKPESKEDADPNWRVNKRTLDNLKPEEKAVLDEYLDSREDGARIRDNLSRLKDTPWAKQAIESVFVRASMLDLMAGRKPRVQSTLDHPKAVYYREDLERGEKGFWSNLEEKGLVGEASKPAHNVNGSFLDCDPSRDCAKFCYATKGNYARNIFSVLKSEMIAEAMERNPARAAEITARNYRGTSEYDNGKALRLFDKGDGNASWVPYIKELNRRGIRVQIFSKRPEFLRAVPEQNVRLLSIDESNKDLAAANPDLQVAFVYSSAEQIPELLKLHKAGRVAVVLPVKQGQKLLDEAQINDLIAQDKTIAKHVCPIDAGWKKIKDKNHPDGWNCTMCDKNGGVGCFVGQTSQMAMNKAAENEAQLNELADMSMDELMSEIQRLREAQNDAIRGLQETRPAADGTDAEHRPVRGYDGGSRVDAISRRLDDVLQELFRRINSGAKGEVRERADRSTAARMSVQSSASSERLENPDRTSSVGRASGRLDGSADREESVSGRTRSGQSGGLKYSQNNWTPDQELIDKAKEHFGVTTNPEEAFYVLPDGTMLDGSGRHWGLSERDVNGRQVDHGDIAEIMDSDGAEAMYEFMGRTGAMRFDRIVGIASVARKPTAQQLAILGRSSKGGYLALSLNTPEGRIVDDTEFDSASPRLIEDFFAQAQEKADRGVAGAWASRGKANARSRTSEVTETLSADPQIGASFRTLTDAGAVNVVETVDDLPADIRSQIDDTEQSRSPMKSPRADIKRGLNAMARLIADHKTQYRAMFRQGLGWIDFEYGSEGSERIKGNGMRKGAEGILHIMEARYRKDGYNEKQIGDLLDDVVYAIADGRETSRQNRNGENLKVTVENFRNGKTTRVALAKTPSSDAWVVTGFHVDGLVATGVAGKGHGNAGATHQRPTLSRPQKGAVATDSVLILGNRVLTIKHSDNGDIQGVYDPASGKSYLIASNLSKDTAKGVFLHEVGVHMANDSAMAADMQPLIRRAVQIVLNGNSNGDATSREVYRRMKAAGVINDRGNIVEGQSEEALAYLVETVANNPGKVSHPIREWFDRLIGAVRRWLYRHGFADATRLSDKDLAAVAVSNVRALAQAKKTKGVKFSKNPDDQKPATEAIQNRLDNGNPVWGYPTQQDEMFGEKPEYIEEEDGTRRTYKDWRRAEKRRMTNEAEIQADEQMRAGARVRGQETPHNRLSDHSLVERDDLGNRKFGYGQWAYDHVTTATHMVFDAIDRALGHNLGFNPLPPEFRKIYRDYKSGLDKSARDIQNVAKLMAEMPVAERRLVSDIIEKMIPDSVVNTPAGKALQGMTPQMRRDHPEVFDKMYMALVNPPEHVVQVAAAISNLMDQQTDEMVRLGLLSKESAERWRGEYLPRIYLQQTELLKEARKDFHRIFDRGTAATGIAGNHFKGRGRWRTVVGDKDIADHKSLGWKIRDPNWSDAQGELQFVGEGQQPKVPTVVMWRDFSPEERRQMGEERDALARVVLGYMESQQDIALARYFQSLAQDSRFVGDVAQEDWVKVPNTTISDTSPVKRYGALAGKYVSPAVWSELKRYNKDANAFTRVWKKLLAAWKEGKTALNPVAHMNNVIGNVAMAHFAGVDAWDTPAYYRTLRSIYRNDKDYQEAEAAGLFSGSWSRAELINLIPEDGVRDRLTGPQPTYEKVLNLFLDYGTLGLRKPLRFLYEKEDAVFKYVIYRDARAKGMSSRDAVDYANQFVFTYDDLPSGARAVRDTALPFFSWTYKAIPVLLRTAMLYPHRFLAPAASMLLANQLAYLALAASAAGDDDDWWTIWQNAQKLKDAEDEALPEQGKGLTLFGTPKFMRLWNNQDGTANFLDVARLVPGGDLMDANNQMGGMPWIQPLMPNSPQIGMFLAIFANKDAFTGREIVKGTDSASEAFRKRTAYVVQSIAPALAPGGYHFSRMANAVAAETGTTLTLEPFFDITGTDWQGRQQDMGKAVAHTLGVKVKPIDLEQEIQRKNRQARGEIKELRGQLRYKAKALARGAVTPEAYESFRKRTVEDIRERVEKMEEFNRKVAKLRK
nr:MAG TPA: ParB ddrB-like ParB superfamily domain [Caudoviricetes sp.]